MIFDWILIVIILGSVVYMGRVMWLKLPLVANVNVRAVPGRRQTLIKRQLLEDKLKRDFKKRWNSFTDFFINERKAAVTRWFSSLYGRLKNFEQEYRHASRKDLSTDVTRIQSVNDIIARARAAIDAEDYAKAEQALIDALALDEHNVKVYTLLAQVYRHQGEYDHARETLEYILHLTNEDDAAVYRSLADLARERGDLHAAQEDYLKSISLDPNNHNHYLELAEVYALLGDPVKAQDAAQKALALAANNPKILDFLIENSILLQDKNKADEYLSKLIAVNPENGKIPSFKEKISGLSGGVN